MLSAGFGKLAREHVCRGHCEGGALPGHQGNAKGGVSDERNAAARPGRHFDLRDRIEIEVVRAIEALENSFALPPMGAEPPAKHRFLRHQVRHDRRRIVIAGEDEQEERPVVMQGKARQHLAGLAVNDINVLVARAIMLRLERRDDVPEVLFDLLLRPEGEPADIRMQAVGADNKVKGACAGMFELRPPRRWAALPGRRSRRQIGFPSGL